MRTDKKCRKSFPRLLSSVSIGAASVALLLSLLFVGISGCDRGGAADRPEIVLYTSVDEPVARPIVAEFTRQTGVRVAIQTDTEANKSAGLVARLEAERANPRADVWWGNEVFRTIALADAGVLAPYDSPAARDIPDAFKDPSHRWAGSGQRVRVIAVTTGRQDAGLLPNESIEDLLNPKLQGQVALADPRAGTTSGHVAALYVLWGDAKAQQFFRGLRDNGAKVLGGNADVANAVLNGPVYAGLTDNDDVENAIPHGGTIRMFLPDQKPGQIGTLTIPCTVALVAGAKHAEDAKKLVDYLLSAEVEKRLVSAKFARYSVREEGGGGEKVKRMDVDYAEVAKNLRRAASSAHAILVGRE